MRRLGPASNVMKPGFQHLPVSWKPGFMTLRVAGRGLPAPLAPQQTTFTLRFRPRSQPDNRINVHLSR
jgi:hypothetical protein